jgi:hypothetical protein
MLQNPPKDKYDFILDRDLLKDLGVDIHYSTSQFLWENIIVNMAPCGYWTKQRMSNMLKPGMSATQLRKSKTKMKSYTWIKSFPHITSWWTFLK